jgi:hypothetical protein
LNKTKKYKPTKRYLKNKNISRKSMKGGNYNTEEIQMLKKILIGYGYREEEISNIMNTFNYMAQKYPVLQLISQLEIYPDQEDYMNLNEEEQMQGRLEVERMLEGIQDDINLQQEGDTDSEKSSASPGFN